MVKIFIRYKGRLLKKYYFFPVGRRIGLHFLGRMVSYNLIGRKRGAI